MSKTIRIALTGQMRAGKDTVCELLEKELTNHFVKQGTAHQIKRYAFGDSLKEYAKHLFPDEFKGGKPRELFQWFGQTMRSRDNGIWIRFVDEKVRTQSSATRIDRVEVSIITDLRQPNEYEYCKNNDYYIIKVLADDEIRLARMNTNGDSFSPSDLQHETEKHVEGYDADTTILNNESDTYWLEEIVEHITGLILQKHSK